MPDQSLNRKQAMVLKKLVAYRNKKAEELGINHNLLVSKRVLIKLVKAYYQINHLDYRRVITGWRAEVFLPGLLQKLESLHHAANP